MDYLETYVTLEYLFEVGLGVLHDDVDRRLVFHVLWRTYLYQFDHARMFQLSK